MLLKYIGPVLLGFVLTYMFLIATVLVAHAEDGRCSQLRSLEAQGHATSGKFTRAQVAMARVWYRRNCGKVRRAG